MKFFELIRRYKWDLGIAFEDEGHRYDASEWNFHIIKAPKDRWFADPVSYTHLDVYKRQSL